MPNIITFDAVKNGKKYHRKIVICPNGYMVLEDTVSDL